MLISVSGQLREIILRTDGKACLYGERGYGRDWLLLGEDELSVGVDRDGTLR